VAEVDPPPTPKEPRPRTVYWVEQRELGAFQKGRTSFLSLLQTADEELQEFLSKTKPFARVCLLRIQPRGAGDFLDGVSRPLPGRPDRVERLQREEPIWDLSDLGKVMVLVVGRNPDCAFQPAIDLNVRFFSAPHPAGLGYVDEFDTSVSREHAWVLHPGGTRLALCAVGTAESPGNGVLLNDDEKVRAHFRSWAPEEFYGFGQVCKNTPGVSPPFISIFRLRYQINKASATETLPGG